MSRFVSYPFLSDGLILIIFHSLVTVEAIIVPSTSRSFYLFPAKQLRTLTFGVITELKLLP